MADIFGIGLSGLSAAQSGLSTTGHNISNANTPGFHRQQIVQSTANPQYTGGGFLGQGVQVSTIKRIYNDFIDNQVLQAQAESSHLDSYLTQINQLDNMLADPTAGLSPALQDFFTAVNGVSANSATVPPRQALLSGAQSLVARFQALNDRFAQIRDGVNGQITSSVSVINSYATQIASMNQKIMLAQASTSQPANDLLDQRDQLIADLNKEVKVSVVKQDNGDYNVFIGNGQALVIGQQALSLATAPNPDDPSRLEVALVAGASKSILPSSSLQGGTLGGVLEFRDSSLDSGQNALGRVAIGLAQTFNDQHKLGQDLNGNLGGDFFTVASPKAIPNTNNTGTATLTPPPSFSNVGLLTTSDYKLVATNNAGGFTMTRLSDGAVVTPASEGLSITMTAGATIGDSWTIQPTRDGALNLAVAITDPNKVAAAAPILTGAASTNTSSATISAGSVNTGTPATPDPAHPSTDLNLQQPVTITFTAPGTFSVSSPTSAPPIALAAVPYTAGANITYNGWTVQINGAPAVGDTFTVGPNTGGVSDNRNALLLGGLQTAKTLDGTTSSYQEAYGQLVSQVGNKAREISVTDQAQANLVSQAQQVQQAFSGVNMDEEAANLIRYQQAYQASGKMIQIASTLFQTLLSLGQ